MTDSMRNGQSGSKELAKELVLEMLADDKTPLAIKYLLENPNVRASTRNILYWLIGQEYYQEETWKLLRWQLDWVLIKNKWTEDSLANVFNWLLQSKVSHVSMWRNGIKTYLTCTYIHAHADDTRCRDTFIDLELITRRSNS